MKEDEKIKIFLVDDDELFLNLLKIQFIQNGDFMVEQFTTGEACVEHLFEKPDVVILDYHLNGVVSHAMNGIETLDQIKKYDPTIPVIMLSSQDKIDVAIECMHHRALDYIVKSETAFVRLQQAIERIFHYQKIEKELNWYMDRM
ncbi:MAG: response regulator [Rhizobacter sp.]|nr:response regulator [Ferruginibacter sp.]